MKADAVEGRPEIRREMIAEKVNLHIVTMICIFLFYRSNDGMKEAKTSFPRIVVMDLG